MFPFSLYIFCLINERLYKRQALSREVEQRATNWLQRFGTNARTASVDFDRAMLRTTSFFSEPTSIGNKKSESQQGPALRWILEKKSQSKTLLNESANYREAVCRLSSVYFPHPYSFFHLAFSLFLSFYIRLLLYRFCLHRRSTRVS